MARTKPTKKKFPGASKKAKQPKVKLVGDSYQADPTDLKAVRKIAKKKGCSKAEVIRYGIKLALMAYSASENGEAKITVTLP